jgi:VWFA-related protein
VLKKKDMAFLISFGPEAELLQDFTNSPRLLEAALRDLRVSSGVGGLHPGPVPTASQQRGTVLFDAIYLGATDRLQKEVGRKAMVVITDGVDVGSRLKKEEAISAAQRADSIVYSIYYVDQAPTTDQADSAWVEEAERACYGKCRKTPAEGSCVSTGRTRSTASSLKFKKRCGASTRSASHPPMRRKTALFAV